MLTAETITDREIDTYRESLPRGHYAVQWCIDAVASPNHPMRKANARRIVAELIAGAKESR